MLDIQQLLQQLNQGGIGTNNNTNKPWETYEEPYNKFGQGQMNTLTDIQNNYLHPNDFINKLMENYQTSDYAKSALGASKEAGMDAASSMGLLGSSNALQGIQQQASDIVGQDKQNYLKQLLGIYDKGAGLTDDIYKTGANAAGHEAGLATDYQKFQQEMEQRRREEEERRKRENSQGFWSGLGKLGGTALGAWASGGASLPFSFLGSDMYGGS